MAPVSFSNGGPNPFLSTPTATAQGANAMEVFASAQHGMWEMGWSGSGWSALGDGKFALPYPDGNAGIEGTPALASWGGGRLDAFAVSRMGKLFWWYSTAPAVPSSWVNGKDPIGGPNPPPLVSSGVSGDPVAVSRGLNELEVFYRTTSGSLVHLTYQNGTWGAPENLLPAGPIL